MAIRRRSSLRRQNLTVRTPGEQLKAPGATPRPAPENRVQNTQIPAEKQPAKEGYLPVAIVLEILAREYEDGAVGKALCRVAAQIAKESGLIEKYRARWDAEETDLSSNLSMVLFDRRQSLELISFHKSRGNQKELDKEIAKLERTEGRLLMGGKAPAKITEEDLEILENFIKESGF